GERTFNRDQPGRSGRREGVAVRSFRPVARLSQMQPGRIPRHGRGLCEALSHPGERRRTSPRGAGMGDDPRLALGPRGLAIHPGSCRPLGREAEGLKQKAALERHVKEIAFADRDQVAPVRYCIGSTGVVPLRTSKCSCGELTLPVWPDFAITCPRLIESPRFTRSSLACAYAVTSPLEWRTSTRLP